MERQGDEEQRQIVTEVERQSGRGKERERELNQRQGERERDRDNERQTGARLFCGALLVSVARAAEEPERLALQQTEEPSGPE